MEETIRAVVVRARSGNFAGALELAERGLRTEPSSLPLLSLAAFAATQTNQHLKAERYLRAHLSFDPSDRAARGNLARLLVAQGRSDDALVICTPWETEPTLARMAGFLLHQAGQHDLAIAAYRTTLAAMPDDAETWNNLGNVLGQAGHPLDAITAFEEAINRGCDKPEVFLNLYRAIPGPAFREQRLSAATEGLARHPANIDLMIARAKAEIGLERVGSGLALLKHAAELEIGIGPACIELGIVLEGLNRIEELATLVERADALGVTAAPEAHLLRSYLHLRRGNIASAKAEASLLPPTIEASRAGHLRGGIAERSGDVDTAFAQYSLMNRSALASHPGMDPSAFRHSLTEIRAQITTASALSPVAYPPTLHPAPIFIVGFPRSGTTLLETLLTAADELDVREERPFLAKVLNSFPTLPIETDADTVNAARAAYFAEVNRERLILPGRRLVDKLPLNMVRTASIHRLFPDAQFVFVERHPCDCILSCFMANFVLNPAMAAFTSLEEAALTYDAAFETWTMSTVHLPLNVHAVRYERMVENLADEMWDLLAFLNLPLRKEMLDNQTAAQRRGVARTASYAQIGQPLYSHAVRRWERYKHHLIAFKHILKPWCDVMGYKY
ncbi:tetratricopeptide repeat-containing sulfotransferase family protein [Novosphingobium olei]|uniref:tetratricopeptide repeat-containing sulfotransferase family protein n=1 Tax=Novosphingobium olei TaxID=2728851 RepID=UPI003090E557|nr:sulfotransferase [Novosphingobium olei]